MKFFRALFKTPQKRHAIDAADAELEAIIVPLQSCVGAYKDTTGVSWVYILEAVHTIAVGFFVQERGIESVKRLYEQIAYDLDSQGGIPVAMHAGCEAPPITEEKLNELRQLLWNFAKQMIAVGHPVEHVAQAYFQFFLKTAEHAARGETWMAKLIIADALQFLRSA